MTNFKNYSNFNQSPLKSTFFILFGLLLFCSGNVSAQVIEWSNAQKSKNKTNYTRILGENFTGLFLARSKNSSFRSDVILERYKSSMGVELSRPLLLSGKSRLAALVLQDDQILYYRYSYNNAINKIELFAGRVDENLSPVGSEAKVSDSPLRSYSDEGDFQIFTSRNKINILAYHQESTGKEASQLVFNMTDEQFGTLFSKSVEIKHDPNRTKVDNIKVDDFGNFMFTTRLTRDRKRSEKGPFSETWLYVYNKKSTEMQSFRLDSSSQILIDVSAEIDNLYKRAMVSGYYSNGNDDEIKGVFHLSYDLVNNQVIEKHYMPFEKNFTIKLLGQEGMNPRDFFILKLIPKSDGGAIMIGENIYTSQQSYTTTVNGIIQTNYRTVFHYDDIMIVSIAPGGSIEWKDLIKKNQASMNDRGYFSSASVMVSGARIYVFYNENVTGTGTVKVSTIDNMGSISTKDLVGNDGTSVLIVPEESRQVAESTFLFSTLRDRKFSLLKVTY